MRNPFKSGESQLGPNDLWICPNIAWEELEEVVERRLNTVILGVKGSGKSTLLNKFFTEEFCARSYVEHNRLIFSAVLARATDGDKLCDILIQALCDAAQKVLDATERSYVTAYLKKLKENKETPKMQFIYLCKWLGGGASWETNAEYPLKKKCTLLLVMDAFERFVSSPKITQDQHDMLRELAEEEIMSFVVATDYDLQETSLPPDIRNSLFIQKFQTKIGLRGFSLQEARDFVTQKISAEDPVQFTENQVKLLSNLTGGIPLLFEMAAYHMYKNLKEQTGITRGAFTNKMYIEVKPTLKKWFKFFTPEYDAVMAKVLGSMPDSGKNALQSFAISSDDNSASNAATLLAERGFWKTGNSSDYQFNSFLLQKYAVQEYLPDIISSVEMEPEEKCYNVFISYKRRNPENKEEETKDAAIAQELCDVLRRERGVVPFLDKEGVENFLSNDVFAAIDAALATAKAFVLICTNPAYLDSHYVSYELNIYNNELRAGRKMSGSFFVVMDMSHEEEDRMELKLPPSLRSASRKNLRDEASTSVYKKVAEKVCRQICSQSATE